MGDRKDVQSKKALNHNTVIAINMADNREYLLIGKGLGFGRKVSERMEVPDGTHRIFSA